jgi:hypothetical protein
MHISEKIKFYNILKHDVNINYVISPVTSFCIPDDGHESIETCCRCNKTNKNHNRMCTVIFIN